MMADTEHGLFEMVVVKDISRFARNTVDLLQNANSHFPRPAGPHFPASQGHIKRSALEIGRARGAPPC